MQKKLIAEGLGTFVLILLVLASINFVADAVLTTPIIAALVVGLFVYTIGPISGCHLNPAVTAGVWSLKKISTNDAAYYIAAQIAGALLAWTVVDMTLGALTFGTSTESMTIFMAELLGTALLTFGIATVVYGKTPDAATGLVIGGSLLLGIIAAVQFGSGGALNPAVALVGGAFSFSYLFGALVGGVLGMQMYKYLRG